jgi:hypothetical protein
MALVIGIPIDSRRDILMSKSKDGIPIVAVFIFEASICNS